VTDPRSSDPGSLSAARPPRLAEAFLTRLLPAADREVLRAELTELYQVRVESRGRRRADRWYWRQLWAFGAAALRRPWEVEAMGTFTQQLRQSFRALRRAPAFTVTAILTLALGIGATVAVFSVVNGVLLQALPYPGADRLVMVFTDSPPNRWNFSVADYLTLEEQQTVFEDFGARMYRQMTYNGNGVAERVLTAHVTPSYLTTLGVAPSLGRVFTPGEGEPRAPLAVIVSHGFWETRMGGDPAAVERSIRLDGRAHRVVGVMPPGVGPLEGATADLWPVLQLEPPTRKGPFFLRVVGRLEPGVSREAAVAELRQINAEMFPVWADSYADQRARWGAISAMDWVVGDVRPALLVLFGGAIFVLLIAATNVANLVVSRATVRSRELAVRSALGASGLRLAVFQITETLLVAVVGGALGLVLAQVGVDVLTGLAPTTLPRMGEIGIDPSVLGFATLTALGSGLLLGLVPSFGLGRRDTTRSLHSGTRGASTGGASRIRNLLVAAQFAVALPLLMGAGLLVGSFANLLDVDPGFDPGRIVSFQLSLPAARYPEATDADAFWSRLEGELAALPGVDAVGLNSSRPPSNLNEHNNFALAIRRTPPGESDPGAAWLAVDRGFFEALQVPLITGRLHDRDNPVPGALVVDQRWVQKHVPPGMDPLGLRLVSGSCTAQAEPEPPCMWQTVVGVVGSVKYTGLDREDDDGAVYFAQPTSGYRNLFVFIGGERVSLTLMPQVREVVQRLDPELAVAGTAGGQELLTASVARPRYLMTLFSVFAFLALTLAAVGIYGVMSYFVSQHTRDIGIRVALGGQRTEVMTMVVARGLRLAVVGVAFGVAAAYVLSRFLEDLLFGVSATDAATFAVIVAVLTAVAAAACWLPARRATRVDPMVALRTD
jgi:putative ABC transport system permease protein